MDSRFKDKAYSRQEKIKEHKILGISYREPTKTIITTGFAPPATRAELEREFMNLPSNRNKKTISVNVDTKESTSEILDLFEEQGAEEFNPVDYISNYEDIADFSPPVLSLAEIELEHPPKIVPFNVLELMDDNTEDSGEFDDE